LLGAWRLRAVGSSSRRMPEPSSSTLIRRMPPACSRTVICRAPASSALSTSSRTTEAGRSTTSPAAIWLISSSGNSRIGRRAGGDGIRPVVSAAFESGVGMAGLVAFAAVLGGERTPAGLDTYRYLATDVLPTRLPLENARIQTDAVYHAALSPDVSLLQEIP